MDTVVINNDSLKLKVDNSQLTVGVKSNVAFLPLDNTFLKIKNVIAGSGVTVHYTTTGVTINSTATGVLPTTMPNSVLSTNSSSVASWATSIKLGSAGNGGVINFGRVTDGGTIGQITTYGSGLIICSPTNTNVGIMFENNAQYLAFNGNNSTHAMRYGATGLYVTTPTGGGAAAAGMLHVKGAGSNPTILGVGAGTTTVKCLQLLQSDGVTEIFSVTDAGNIKGKGGSTSMTDGFFYIPAAAGAPSGTPTSISGSVPMYFDSTNNNFYVYNGAWKKVNLT